tara:strand:- start:293 stop:526 length:234 start_codon:yes stop_codon:yes gene_type:complete
MQPIILIQWNTLTTGWDSYVNTFSSNEQMTYLDLLTTLENLPEEELLKPVTLYDEDVNDYLKVRRVEQKEFDTYLII